MGLSPKSNYEKKIVSCFDIGEVDLELALFSAFHFHFRTGCLALPQCSGRVLNPKCPIGNRFFPQKQVLDFLEQSRKSASTDLICCCCLSFSQNLYHCKSNSQFLQFKIQKDFLKNAKRIPKEFPKNSQRIPNINPQHCNAIQKNSQKFSKQFSKVPKKLFLFKKCQKNSQKLPKHLDSRL